jgi:hypothetical protein
VREPGAWNGDFERKDSSISWEAPTGTWQVLVLSRSRLYKGTHAEVNLAKPLPYPNLLRREPTARFLELTHGRYAWHLGTDLGRYFVSTFTDEPSLMSMYFRRMPWRPLPWSPELPAEFARRRGYALEPVLASLVLDTGPEGYRHRHDFWRTVGELVSENYFGQIQETCRALRISSGGHLLAEEGLTSHVALYGDFFACLRRMDAPSIDCLTSIPSEVPWHIAKLAAGAADLTGNAIVMCETSDHAQVWRAPGDSRPTRSVTEAEIRGTINRLVVSGVNSITSYYSFVGLDDAALVRLNEWTGRICALMRGGRPAGKIAVVYPGAALAARFVPAQHWATASPGANRIDLLFRAVMAELAAAGREFSVIDELALSSATVRRGELILGDSGWKVVVLPGADVLGPAAWANLERLTEQGGAVVSVGNRPWSDGQDYPAPAVLALSERVWGPPSAVMTVKPHARRGGWAAAIPAGQELLLGPLLHGTLPADVVTAKGQPSVIRVAHRRIDGAKVFLVVNDSPEPWSGRLTFAADGLGMQLDPALGRWTGGISPDGIDVQLGSYGAAGFRFPTGYPTTRRLAVPTSVPRLVWEPMAVGTPIVSRGEWVREEFSPVEADSTEPVWDASARIVKSDVDTFLFVRFPVSDSAALVSADGLGLRVSVPEGVRPATQLLVVIAEAEGGDFIGSTLCSLAKAGTTELVVPWSRLELAGWSRDADGKLDRSRIAEIRVGWGGYHGAEGERIEFRVGRPAAVRVKGPVRAPIPILLEEQPDDAER